MLLTLAFFIQINMAILRETASKNQTVIDIAKKMMIAARTAPKGRGKDSLEMMIISGNEIITLAETLEKLGHEMQVDFYLRDANNIKSSEAILLIGTEIKPLGLQEICQLCGFENCTDKEKHPNTPCVFNTGDLNLAIGSAVSLAADLRIDNRVMFSVGKAALASNFFEKNIKIAFGIPLSASSKNPFFDRN